VRPGQARKSYCVSRKWEPTRGLYQSPEPAIESIFLSSRTIIPANNGREGGSHLASQVQKACDLHMGKLRTFWEAKEWTYKAIHE
jgi:hypothetical protein